MHLYPNQSATYSLSTADQVELNKLVSTLELSSSTTTIFAIAPESEPQHPIVEQLKNILLESDDNFEPENFFYSDNSLHNFIHKLDTTEQNDGVRTPQPPLKRGASDREQARRKLVMAFGIDQLPTPRLVREMKQLNLGRETLFNRDLVLIFWLNKEEFLEEFRNRAPDFWDWRGKVVRFEARPPMHRLFYPYLQWLIAENSYMKISGVMQVQRQVDIFLDQIYVSLQAVKRKQVMETLEREQRELEMATSRQSDRLQKLTRSSSSLDELEEPYYYEPVLHNSVHISTSTKTVTQKVNLSQAVRENQYSVILGDPGAGKTTLLRYLALHFATAKRDGEETVKGGAQEELGKLLLPIFFRIADYAERLAQQPDLTLLDYLHQFYRQWEAYFETEAGTEVAALLLEKMRQGQCLMLLDGLDEVFDQESRKQIVERINQFVDAFSTNKFVITSRIAGYRDVKLSDRFTEFTIEDMGSEEVEKFLHRWCRAVEHAQQPDATEEQCQKAEDAEAQEILEAIKDNEGVKRLTANPLLLTILALIHRNGSRLPNRRVELYALAVKTLTEDWQLGKKLPDASKVVLKENEVVELLAPLAYWMHEEKPSGLVTQAEVEEQLAAKLAELNDAEPESDSVLQAVQEFLRKVRETTGLFVERAPGVYGFMHLTFEEYFAARYIVDNDQSEILQLIHKHLHEPRWNEPILLALSYYGIHSPKQVNKLVELLFSNLDIYEPVLPDGKVKIKNTESPDAILVLSSLQGELATCIQPELWLKNLLFAGQVLAQVEVNSSIRKKLIEVLILTVLALDDDSYGDACKQLVRLLRQIEMFNQKGEVIAELKQAVNDSTLSELARATAQLTILYTACGEPGTALSNYVTDIVNQLNPLLFGDLKEMFAGVGEETTPALEATLENCEIEQSSQQALIFITALSYIRTDHYAKAITLLEELICQQNNSLSPYLSWALAACYEAQENYQKAIEYYEKSYDRLATYPQQNSLRAFWYDWGYCYSLNTKHEQSLKCFQKLLAIDQDLNRPQAKANTFYEMGRAYQEWGKYEQAIEYHQQSRDLYQQLGREKKVANQWGWLANTYRDWGKYEQAIECQQQCLLLYQKLNNQSKVASTYLQLGRTYQAWGKYEIALTYYQQSRELYQQLGQEENVANPWYWLAAGYHDCGKYEMAVECELKDLEIRQQLDDQPNIAHAHWQLGYIYQAWGKYEIALAHYQQSRDLYEQLGQPKNMADQWYWLAACYRDWSKYELAEECELKDLAIRQQLDDQAKIASAYLQLGRIYQAWGKYEQALAHYQQSRVLYEQLGKQQIVANHWYWQAECYYDWGKYEMAVECELKDLDIRLSLNDQPNIADAYCQLGRSNQAWGKYEIAIAHYQNSRDFYKQLGQEQDVANQCFYIANCYRIWGKYERALEYQQQCLTLRQQLEDQSRVALAYYQLGKIYQNSGKYEEASAHYQQSRELYQQLEQEENVANLWYWLADCYRKWGKYELAVDCKQNELAIHQKLDDQSEAAFVYFQIGSIHQNWGKYSQAIAYHQQSCELYEQLGQQQNVADQLYWQAACYYDWGKYEMAVERALKNLSVCQKLNDQPSIASAYIQLGRIYQAWGKYELALAHYQQSRVLYEQLGKQQIVANHWYWQAECYWQMGKYELAVECELEDLAIRQQLEDQHNIADANYQLGRFYQAWGKYELALAHYQQSRELYEQLGKQQDVANQWYWLAACYRDWGKYELAVECELEDLAIRQQLEDQHNIADAYWQLGRIYQAWGKYEEAIAHYQKSRELYQQLGREQDVASQYQWLADCYCQWGKYELAVDCKHNELAIRQKLDDQSEAAFVSFQIGSMYQDWGKYSQAIAYHQQSCELYEQLGQQHNVANQWYHLGDCYSEWGKYEQAVEYQQKCLTLRQQLDDQPRVALANSQLGRIYQAWGKYEQAITYYQQSYDLYEQLGQQQNLVNQWNNLAKCYQDLSDYTRAIEYYQQSRDLHQKLSQNGSEARHCRQIGNSQRLLAKNTLDKAEAFDLLKQAEQNIRQAIQKNTAGDYRGNLAYDYIALSLHWSERLRFLPAEDSSLPEQIAQFEEYYNTGLAYLAELGQTVDRADEALDIARAYLEVNVLENLDRAEELAQESLQVFQDYNRRKLEAAARKLLGEIYLKRAQQNQPSAEATATQFLSESLQIYRELDLNEKAAEVEQLMHYTP
ncbi:tetratricopeptide repeat protein [Iningainema tapete]|uniref:Tetratricopeptide repeat protein n=1 Tax=Iningainema tapete BLCC-T55 TaxID=2748662 RepID=A0A8J6XGK5_9CYAN|nr:tetratricopeptide repeat protein [Iningainema tapete]MBD2771626.1 tetratricopeptide repeat protein [Iningainema tapete BLCC-T55]